MDFANLFVRPDGMWARRENGELEPLPADTAKEYYAALQEASVAKLQGASSCDFDWTPPAGSPRFRAHGFRHESASTPEGVISFSLRPLPDQVPSIEALGLPGRLQQLAEAPGLHLYCGPTGAGKSTTMAAICEALRARSMLGVMVTVEDPVEYRYDDPLIFQRRIGTDVATPAEGIRDAMRENPDTIMVSEIRDADAAAAAVEAGLSGHRVMATLHADNIRQALFRLHDRLAGGDSAGVMPDALSSITVQRLVRVPGQDRRLALAEYLEITEPARGVVRAGPDYWQQISHQMQAQGISSIKEQIRFLE